MVKTVWLRRLLKPQGVLARAAQQARLIGTAWHSMHTCTCAAAMALTAAGQWRREGHGTCGGVGRVQYMSAKKWFVEPWSTHAACSCRWQALMGRVGIDVGSSGAGRPAAHGSHAGTSAAAAGPNGGAAAERSRPAGTSGAGAERPGHSRLSDVAMRARREDAELRQRVAAAMSNLPTSIDGFKNHPVYVLKRHISKYEVGRAGSLRGQKALCLSPARITCCSAEPALKQGRASSNNRVGRGVRQRRMMNGRGFTADLRAAD
eukprot:361277-Chlamydomonas_euryale.AAC.2